jgi:tetratricopeptide (TPR) repeat protein
VEEIVRGLLTEGDEPSAAGHGGTRYDLGRAYKEEGLLDEAIAAFTLAARDESRVVDCSSMLGLCFIEKGMSDEAVTWFERALQAVGLREE